MLHDIVRDHFGSVAVHSSPGVGSTFEVTLSASKGMSAAALSAHVRQAILKPFDGPAPHMASRLEGAKLSPASVTLAVCANDIAFDPPSALLALQVLREAGFGLLVEDYGAGHAWDPWLARVPFSELAIDANSLAGWRIDPGSDANVVRALDTARRWKLEPVARGIRNLDEWNQLQEWGCCSGQPCEADFGQEQPQQRVALPLGSVRATRRRIGSPLGHRSLRVLRVGHSSARP